jgi:hypothetical protein
LPCLSAPLAAKQDMGRGPIFYLLVSPCSQDWPNRMPCCSISPSEIFARDDTPLVRCNGCVIKLGGRALFQTNCLTSHKAVSFAGKTGALVATEKRVFFDSAQDALVLRLHLGAEGQGDEQAFFCGFDRFGFDADKLFWLGRLACIRWRPDGNHWHYCAKEKVSLQRNSPTIS